jgi:hypothetical protein
LPFPLTGTIDVKADGAEHVELFGPKALKVMVPVGDAPPARVAVSEILPPAVAEGVAWVVMVGLALVTVEVSAGSLQAVVAELLLTSPL